MNARTLVALALTALAACSESVSHPSEPSATSLFVTLGSSGASPVASLSMKLEDIQLLARGQLAQAELLAVPQTLELTSLSSVAQLVAILKPLEGTYDGMRFVFDPDSVSALSMVGDPVPVRVTGNTFEFGFAQSLTLIPCNDTPSAACAPSSIAMLGNIDLAGSISEDGMGGVTFVPRGRVEVTGAPDGLLRGMYARLVHTEPGRLHLGVFEPEERELFLYPSFANLERDTLLLDEDGQPFSSVEEFVEQAGVGGLIFRVEGELTSGEDLIGVAATSIRIEPDVTSSGFRLEASFSSSAEGIETRIRRVSGHRERAEAALRAFLDRAQPEISRSAIQHVELSD